MQRSCQCKDAKTPYKEGVYMTIYLRAFSHLAQWNEGTQDWVKVETNETNLKAILQARDFPLDEVCFIVKNGEFMDWDDVVVEGDRIELIPPIEGG